MPNLEEHCNHSKDRYSVEGRDIHIWLDEPCRIYAGNHRILRHDIETIELVGKIFGDKYGVTLAKNIASDHIYLDRIEKKEKEFEMEKPEYEKKREELNKELLREQAALPEIKIADMKNYLDRFFGHKKPELRQLAEVSLKHWQSYLLSLDNPYRPLETKDITRFVSQLNKKLGSPRTVSNYLGQLVLYFKHTYNEELTNAIKRELKVFDKEIAKAEKNKLPIRVSEVQTLYRAAILPDKVAIRLLLFENIPITKLGKIYFFEELNGKYHFSVNKEEKSLNEETIKIAKPLLKEVKGDNKRLLDFGDRQLDQHFYDLCIELGMINKITPMDLRKFGKNHHPDDLTEWLSMINSRPTNEKT